MKRTLTSVSLITLLIILVSWGYSGHKKINSPVAGALPSQMDFLKASWSTILPDHASDADYRKNTDPTESPKHYIDIDVYPLFVQEHRIPMTWDSVSSLYGSDFVIDNGILPWATITAYDSVKACFSRKDWNKASLFAADLGHYVGDGHMPLHITKNYNGQFTGQTGVHSRYETKMINAYVDQVDYELAGAVFIPDVSSYIFSYLYSDYYYVDSVLIADQEAYLETGSHSSPAFLAAYWQRAGSYTTMLFKKASQALADLIYTAWVEAGSPSPTGVWEKPAMNQIGEIYPNPSHGSVTVPLDITIPGDDVSVSFINEDGKTVEKFQLSNLSKGRHEISWNADTISPGVYFAVLTSGKMVSVKRFLIVN